jgi:phage gp29-like protein
MRTKNKPKHTPGPWRIGKEVHGKHGSTTTVFDEDGEMRIATTTNVCSSINAEANTALIAAAPDILEALERLTDYLNDRDLPESIEIFVNEALAAIRKARGES